MVKVNKEREDIPDSLKVDEISVQRNPARTTQERRLELLQLQKYPDVGASSRYDRRYKLSDIKVSLNRVYHGKCAFCETSLELLAVEHFRPKRGGYYWLAYSWDNLLLSCPICNTSKSNSFPIDGERVSLKKEDDIFQKIHSLSRAYDVIEKPLLIDPETVDPILLDAICFDRNGRMFSLDRRVQTTIDICKLDRESLRERRQSIWDELRKEIGLVVSGSCGDVRDLKILLRQSLKAFKEKAKDPKQPYLAYRRFILNQGRQWIKEIILNKENNG